MQPRSTTENMQLINNHFAYNKLILDIAEQLDFLYHEVEYHKKAIIIYSPERLSALCTNLIARLLTIDKGIVDPADCTRLLVHALNIYEKQKHNLQKVYISARQIKSGLDHLVDIDMVSIIHKLLELPLALHHTEDVYVPALRFGIASQSPSVILSIHSQRNLDSDTVDKCIEFALEYRIASKELVPLELIKLFNQLSPNPRTAEMLWDRFPSILNYRAELRNYIISVVETVKPNSQMLFIKPELSIFMLYLVLSHIRSSDKIAPQIWSEPINDAGTNLFTYAINTANNQQVISRLFALESKPPIHLDPSNPEDPLLLALRNKQNHTAKLILNNIKKSDISNISIEHYINLGIDTGCDFNIIEHLHMYIPFRNFMDLIKDKFNDPNRLKQKFPYDHRYNRDHILGHVIADESDDRVRELTTLEIMALKGNDEALMFLLSVGADINQPLAINFSDAHNRVSCVTEQMSLLSLALTAFLYIVRHQLNMYKMVKVVKQYVRAFTLLHSNGSIWTGSDVLELLELKRIIPNFKNSNEFETETANRKIRTAIANEVYIGSFMLSSGAYELVKRCRMGKVELSDLNYSLRESKTANIDYNFSSLKNTNPSKITLLGSLLDLLLNSYLSTPNDILDLASIIHYILNNKSIDQFAQYTSFMHYINLKSELAAQIPQLEESDPASNHLFKFNAMLQSTEMVDTQIMVLVTIINDCYAEEIKNQTTRDNRSYLFSHHENHYVSRDIVRNIITPMVFDIRVCTEETNSVDSSASESSAISAAAAAAAPRPR